MVASHHSLDYYAHPDDPRVAARRWCLLVSVASALWLLPNYAVLLIFQRDVCWYVPYEWHWWWFDVVFFAGSFGLAAAPITIAILYRHHLSGNTFFVLFMLTLLLILAAILAPSFLLG